MPDLNRRTIGDLTLCALVIAGSTILFVGAADLPPPRFEPMGSAAVPRILGAILIVLSLVVAVQALRAPRTGSEPPAAIPYRGTAVLIALVAYVAALDVLRVPFVIATPVFVVATGLAMSHLSLRNTLMFAALGLGVALLLDTVLSKFLYITIG
jgi:putative tricarboxylic transport membrane protein